MSKIRWRLVIGLISFGATLLLTAPAVASRLTDRPLGEIWPNPAEAQVADSLRPDGAVVLEIWPNASFVWWQEGANSDSGS